MDGRLAELLARDRVITPEQLTTAVDDSRRTRKGLAETVIDLGFVDERRFAQWISQASGTRLADPISEDHVAQLERRLPPATARLRMVVPVGEEADLLYVATVDPFDDSTMQVLKATSGAEIVPVTGIRSEIERLVNRFYPEQMDMDVTLLPRARFNFDLGEPVVPPWEQLGPEPEPMPVPRPAKVVETPRAPWEDETPISMPWAEPPETPNIAAAPVSEAEPEKAPFDFSNETIISSRRSLSVFADEIVAPPKEEPPQRFGTVFAQPMPDLSAADAPADDGSLARIEARLNDIAAAVDRVQKRLDALDATLMRFMNR